MLLCLLFMVLGISFLARLGQPRRSPAIGQPLPELQLQPLVNTKTLVSQQEIAGKVVVLHFWGTWCPPCRLEFPGFAKVEQKFRDNRNVVLLSVSCSGGPEDDLKSLASQTQDYLSKQSPQMATYCDPTGMTRLSIGKLLTYGELGYPTTVLVDRTGNIAQVWEGYTPDGMNQLERLTDALLP